MSKTFALFSCFMFFSLCNALPAAGGDLRESYGAGRSFMEEGEWRKALEIFQTIEKDYALLRDYVIFDMATSYEKSGAPESAVASYRTLINDYRQSPLYRKAYRKILQIRAGDLPSTLRDYDRYLREYPDDGKALWEKAELLEKTGMEQAVISLWKQIFLSGSSYAMSALKSLKATGYQPPRDDTVKAAGRLAEQGHYGAVVVLLANLQPRNEKEKYLLGRAYFNLRRYRDAISHLSGINSPEGIYLLAMSLIRSQEKDAFYRLMEQSAQRGQKDMFSLHTLAAELKRREGKFEEASGLLSSLHALYPEREEDILWAQAWLAIRQNNFGEAEKLLSRLTTREGKEQDKYLFWLGKINVYQGRSGEAFFSKIKGTDSLYCLRAGNRVNLSVSDAGKKEMQTGSEAPLPKELNRTFARIAELESLNMLAEARAETRLALGSVRETDVPVFARLLQGIEDYAGLVKLGIRYDLPYYRYPLAFRDIVYKYAPAQKIDPLLVMAVMREESRFKHDALSGAGAIGVMQLMPQTARKVGNIRTDAELIDAGKNIRVGTMYLSRLLNRFRSLYYSIAAYNAGEHNVDKWLEQGYKDEDEFAEDIPFGETKKYVSRVMHTYGIMKYLYANESKQGG